MARTKKTGPAEDLMDLVALLPWWVGVALVADSLKSEAYRGRSAARYAGTYSGE